MYRRGVPIGATLQASRTSFYSHPHDIDDSPEMELRGGPRMGLTLENKMDEMMSMMSGTQQLVLAQQATTKRLESTVAKISTEVENLQCDFKKISEGSAASNHGTKPKCRSKVPTELRVSI